jgi:sugar lactone lactonase YvrE
MAEVGTEEVVVLTMEGECRKIVDVPGTPCGMGFLPDGTPLVLSLRERRLWRIIGNELEEHADLSTMSPFLNDMVVDHEGRAYVGDTGYDVLTDKNAKPGTIILVQPDGRASVVAEGLHSPNGCVITGDGRLVMAESLANRLASYPINPDGTLGDRPTLIELDGIPDGICLDAEGGIWVALFDKDRFDRVLDGKVVDTVETPGRRAIACQLGGPDGRTLFCLTYEGQHEDIGKTRTTRVETTVVDVQTGGSP